MEVSDQFWVRLLSLMCRLSKAAKKIWVSADQTWLLALEEVLDRVKKFVPVKWVYALSVLLVTSEIEKVA